MSNQPNLGGERNSDKIWLLIGIGVLIRLVFIGLLDALPEEAYYWNYAKHLSIGYLDHPPMVAWLMYVSEALLGHGIFAVRLPAFLGWIAFAFFMYRFAERTAGAGTGKIVVLLLATLPIYMSVGFIMTPDAPLYVWWAATLYFLERAILARRANAWYLGGLTLGLGLLSKYTMGLLVPATLIFLLADKESRRWFVRPQPYIALLIACAVFSPVIIWNYQHDWASFAFQGSRRWSGGINFQLHVLIGSVLVLITPLGLYEAVAVFVKIWKNRLELYRTQIEKYRTHLFLATFTIVPLSVFIIHSLRGQPKLNWTGPVWLAILPLIAARIAGMDFVGMAARANALARRWQVTVSLLLAFYAVGFSYMVLGMPGMHKQGGMKLPIAWKAYGARVEEIESQIEATTHREPLIVGLDKYWLTSEARFYDTDDADTLPEFGGENLVGGNGLMWKQWLPPQLASGRLALLLSFNENRLEENQVTSRFTNLSRITKEVLMNRYGEIGHFYWRTGEDYQPE